MGKGAIKLGKENPCHQSHFILFHSTQVTYDMTLCIPAQRQKETHSLANVTELVNTEVKISKQDLSTQKPCALPAARIQELQIKWRRWVRQYSLPAEDDWYSYQQHERAICWDSKGREHTQEGVYVPAWDWQRRMHQVLGRWHMTPSWRGVCWREASNSQAIWISSSKLKHLLCWADRTVPTSRLNQRARLGVGGREADKQLGRPGMDHLIEYTMKSLHQGTSSSMLKERRMCFRGDPWPTRKDSGTVDQSAQGRAMRGRSSAFPSL